MQNKFSTIKIFGCWTKKAFHRRTRDQSLVSITFFIFLPFFNFSSANCKFQVNCQHLNYKLLHSGFLALFLSLEPSKFFSSGRNLLGLSDDAWNPDHFLGHHRVLLRPRTSHPWIRLCRGCRTNFHPPATKFNGLLVQLHFCLYINQYINWHMTLTFWDWIPLACLKAYLM